MSTKTASIKYVQIYGERNSGTNFLRKLVNANVKDVKTAGYFGWHHTDIGIPWAYYDDSGKFLKGTSRDPKDNEDTLFIVVYRNPFTWLQSMHKSPHHAPELVGLPFSKFIRSAWRSYYGPVAADLSPDLETRMSIVKPENLFEEYDSVIDLRKQKTEVFENFKNKLTNVVYVNYEALRDNPEPIIKLLAKTYDLALKSKFSNIDDNKFSNGKFIPTTYKQLSRTDTQYILDSLDQEQEKSIGYELKPMSPIPSKVKFLAKKALGRPTGVNAARDCVEYHLATRAFRHNQSLSIEDPK